MFTQRGEEAEDRAARRGHGLAGLLLAACLVFFYRDVVFGGRTSFMLDLAPGTMSGLGAYGHPGTGRHPLPAGHHIVEFVYFPLRLKLAVAASALTGVALLGWG